MDAKLKVFEDRLTKCETSNDNNESIVIYRNNNNLVAQLNRVRFYCKHSGPGVRALGGGCGGQSPHTKREV